MICLVVAVQELVDHLLIHASALRRSIRHFLVHLGRRLVVGTSKPVDLTGPESPRQVPYFLTEGEQPLRRVLLPSDQVQRSDIIFPVDLHLQPGETANAKDLHQWAKVLEVVHQLTLTVSLVPAHADVLDNRPGPGVLCSDV